MKCDTCHRYDKLHRVSKNPMGITHVCECGTLYIQKKGKR